MYLIINKEMDIDMFEDFDLSQLDIDPYEIENATKKEYETKNNAYRLEQKNIYSNKPCCFKDTKLIFSHGQMTDQLIILPSDYKVIFLAIIGEIVYANLDISKKLVEIYKNGNTLFDNNDESVELSQQGKLWIEENENKVEPILFIGRNDDHEIVIPEVHINFAGETCNNWDNEIILKPDINPTNYGCLISCVGNQSATICDKYYGRERVELSEILTNEGPGTYLVYTCLCTNYFLNDEQIQLQREYLYTLYKTQISLTKDMIKHLSQLNPKFFSSYKKSIPNIDLSSDCIDLLTTKLSNETKNQHCDNIEIQKICSKSCGAYYDLLSNTAGQFFGKSKSKSKSKNKSKNKSKSRSKNKSKSKSKSKSKLELKRLQKKAKKLKIRITKKVRGKRVYKTIKELKKNLKIKK